MDNVLWRKRLLRISGVGSAEGEKDSSLSFHAFATHSRHYVPSPLKTLRLGAHLARPFYAAQHPSYETPSPRWQYNAEQAVK